MVIPGTGGRDRQDEAAPTPEAIHEDEERVDTIRAIVDDVARQIVNGMLTEMEARDLAATVRFQMTRLIPDQMDTYDLIYGSRFERLIQQFIVGKR